ncbi:galactonate dehydratase [Sphaerisporangium melleum]|uniref:Galactonate dehydratase n=1 Tax=Sphaerisporangium melleum TaxID=321316 RepID=A0A917VU55_9ACTN|nr:galactonate dehydratase [Sphaerisporangium melleum]GGL14411.1 galactonate dehydratase [Sphaerisporangium melleum]GII68188.1 galactonate dehydratase [Sphaerisporangium melleum]
MKIEKVETFLVPPRWLFCRVETDEGVVGWGEPVVEGRAESVRAAVHTLAEYLLGRDPLRIEDHWQVMATAGFYRGGPVLSSALAGLDQALWDIAGKTYGAPVHALLGGPVRDRVRMYAWVGGDEPGELADSIAARVEAGFTAIKMNAVGRMPARHATQSDVHGVVERVALAREVLGPGRDVAVDFHGRVGAADARRILPLIAAFQPMFAEEPVLPDRPHLLRDVVTASSVPVATGERLYSRWDFRQALEAGVAVVQPDLSHAGGISETRRIAALAEVWDAKLAPHCPLGPIALAASLQVAFATPNFLIQEHSIGIHYEEGAGLLDYVMDAGTFRFTDGYATRSDAPGLGVQIDEAAVRKAGEKGHAWRNPVWRHEDGGLAEW